MEAYRTVLRLIGVLVGVALSGSGCAWLTPPQQFALPRTLPPSPTIDNVVRAVNNNSSQIYSFSTDEARLSVQGFPSLRANIAFERPKRLRIRADTAVTGPELDIGSNDELFWIWVMRDPPLYYCRHDQFACSAARRMFPIDPDWLIEALGIVQLDPTLPHQGPTPLPGGRLQICTTRQTVDGLVTKITVVDGVTAAVLEQHLSDAQGQPIASALAGSHRQDPLSGLIMPKTVDIRCPRAQFSMRIDLGNVKINRPLVNPAQLFTMPVGDTTPPVDLGNTNLQLTPASHSSASLPRIRL